MEIIPNDIIKYIGDAYLDLVDIVHWQNVNKTWQKLLSNIVWSAIPYEIKIMDTEILRGILTCHKFRKVNLSDTMITDDFGELLKDCYEVIVMNCFNLTDQFVMALENCYSLNIMKCVNVTGIFLETKRKWNYLNVNGCYRFDLAMLDKIEKINIDSEIFSDINDIKYIAEKSRYYQENSRKFSFPMAPSWKDIFRGYPKTLDYESTENVINDYISKRTKYIESFIGINLGRTIQYIFRDRTKYNAEIVDSVKNVYERFMIQDLIFDNDLYFCVLEHGTRKTNMNNCYWKPNYSHEKDGKPLDHIIDDLKSELNNYYNSNSDLNIKQKYSIQALESKSQLNMQYINHDEKCFQENRIVNDFIDSLMRYRNSDHHDGMFCCNNDSSGWGSCKHMYDRSKYDNKISILNIPIEIRNTDGFFTKRTDNQKDVGTLWTEQLLKRQELDNELQNQSKCSIKEENINKNNQINEILMNRCAYESYDYENNKYKSWECTTLDDYHKKRRMFDLVFSS